MPIARPLALAAAAMAVIAQSLLAPAAAQDRIVSLGGDVTEIIYALGEGGRVVATDDMSVFPEDAEAKPKLGYVRRLSAEGVLSAEPDIIFISGAAGPPEAVGQLEASGVPIVAMDADYRAEGILAKVDTVAAALGAEAQGQDLRASIEADIARARDEVSSYTKSPTVLFFAALTNGALRAAGKDTAAHGVISMMGGTNVFADQSGYKTLSMEAAVAADPDVIILMDHHLERVGGLDGVRNHPALALTSAAQNNRILTVDQVTVMQFGPRTPRAVADLAERVADMTDEAR